MVHVYTMVVHYATLINRSRGKGYLIDFGSKGMSGSLFVYLTRQMRPDRSTVPPGRRFRAGDRASFFAPTVGAISSEWTVTVTVTDQYRHQCLTLSRQLITVKLRIMVNILVSRHMWKYSNKMGERGLRQSKNNFCLKIGPVTAASR